MSVPVKPHTFICLGVNPARPVRPEEEAAADAFWLKGVALAKLLVQRAAEAQHSIFRYGGWRLDLEALGVGI